MRKNGGVIWGVAICLAAAAAHADIVTTRDGREVRGIVIEDYQNRIVFSTPDGEIEIMKADIKELSFDSEEDNLIKLAAQARQRRDYQRAYYYYDMALKINPDSKVARDGLAFSHGYLFRKEEAKKEADIRRRTDFERFGVVGSVEKSPADELTDAIARLNTSLGIALAMKQGVPRIESVRTGSPAYDAGIRAGDLLVSVWSRLTGYLALKEVIDILLDRPSVEIKCTVERTVVLPISRNRTLLMGTKELIGLSFSMEFDGLTIAGVEEDGMAYKAGIRAGDLVTALDGKSTRYMPLKSAVELIKGAGKESVQITFRRQVVMWRIRTQ